MNARSVLVQPVSPHEDLERRVAERHASQLEALTRPLDTQDTLWWGATIRDISTTGVALTVCFPFRPGTYLAIDLQGRQSPGKALLTRVVHVEDKSDGTWHVGCEFLKKLTDSDLELMV
jgi:hypothetical protein